MIGEIIVSTRGPYPRFPKKINLSDLVAIVEEVWEDDSWFFNDCDSVIWEIWGNLLSSIEFGIKLSENDANEGWEISFKSLIYFNLILYL